MQRHSFMITSWFFNQGFKCPFALKRDHALVVLNQWDNVSIEWHNGLKIIDRIILTKGIVVCCSLQSISWQEAHTIRCLHCFTIHLLSYYKLLIVLGVLMPCLYPLIYKSAHLSSLFTIKNSLSTSFWSVLHLCNFQNFLWDLKHGNRQLLHHNSCC